MSDGPESRPPDLSPERYSPEQLYRVEDAQLPGSSFRVRTVSDGHGNSVRLETYENMSLGDIYVFNLRTDKARDALVTNLPDLALMP